MASLILISSLTTVFYFIYTASCLLKNVRAAKKSGLPYMIVPTTFFNAFYSVLLTFKATRYIVNHWFPQPLADMVNNSDSIGRWTVKDRMFARHGSCYLVVSPSRIVLDAGEASIVRQVFNNRDRFDKPVHLYELLSIYGPNIVASDNKDWPRHRHHATPAFNEKSNYLVWENAIMQATGMLDESRGGPTADPESFELRSVRDSSTRMILQVMASAGFGISLPYNPSTVKSSSKSETLSVFADAATPPLGYSFTFRAALVYMSINLRTVLFTLKILPKWIPRSLHPSWKEAANAYGDLKNYLLTLIEVAKTNDAKGCGSNNLLQLLVRSNEATKNRGKDYRLNATEMLGDVHMFTIAGFETTATTFRFALVLLALHPEKQMWFRQGIKEALKDQTEDPTKWSYTEIFPKLVTPLCVMMETLRLFPAVITIPKWIGNTEADIECNGKTYTLPAKTYVNVNLNTIHYRKAYWGSDVDSFVPERWDATNQDSFLAKNKDQPGLTAPGLEFPTLHKPIRGAYVPFSDGSRSCLGKKFAQVEFTVMLAVIFRDYEVVLAKDSPEESYEESERKAWKSLNDASTTLTLAMEKDVPLLFQKART